METKGDASTINAQAGQPAIDSDTVLKHVSMLSQTLGRTMALLVSERLLLLSLLDILLINIALLGTLAITTDFPLSAANILANSKWFITLTIVWLGCANFFDCYSIVRAANTIASMRSTLLATIATILVYSLIPYLTPPLTTRGAIFYFTALAAILLLTWRILYAQAFVQPRFERRALIVGASDAGQRLVEALYADPDKEANPYSGTGYQVVGYIDDDVTLHGESINQVFVLGGNSNLVHLVKILHIHEIILAIGSTQAISDEMMNALLSCSELGIRVTSMSDVYERLTNRVPIDYVGRDLLSVLPMQQSAWGRTYLLVKRVVDIAIALVGLCILLIALIPIALANNLTSPGPLFYVQKRVGQGGKVFQIYKFRSMRPDAERETGAVWARRNDDRITPVGRFLRRTRLDELPQFINVLKGEMSIIGPRPERPEFVNALALMIPYYRVRHAVKPGMTGWAEVKHGRYDSYEDTRTKVEYDLYYVKHLGPLLDIIILLQTFPTMLLGAAQGESYSSATQRLSRQKPQPAVPPIKSQRVEPASSAYAIARIKNHLSDQPLILGKEYILQTGIRTQRSRGFASIKFILPTKAATDQFEIIVYAQDMEVKPEFMQRYSISSSTKPPLAEFMLKPIKPGRKQIRADFFYRQHWLAKIELDVTVMRH